MRMITLACVLLTCLLLTDPRPSLAADSQPVGVAFVVTPPKVELSGPYDRIQLLVAAASDEPVDARSADLTRDAEYSATDPDVVQVDPQGRVTAIADGQTEIEIKLRGTKRRITVDVEGVSGSAVDFYRDVRPILNKAGCAAGACHAAQFGKGGFKLSVFGFDPQADYEAITRSSRGRRVNFSVADKSLLLRKPAMQEAHGGGERLEHDSIEYKIVRDWIESAAPASAEAAKVESLQVFPGSRVGQLGFDQQLRVVAHYADGSQRDVTAVALYDAIDKGILLVSDRGLISTIGKGQSAVMVRYDGQATLCTVVVPYRDQIELADWQSNNYVDELAADKFRDLGLAPSPRCDDATYIRRVFLDCIGSLPSPELVRDFLASDNPDKRVHLVDRLLGLTGDSSLDTFNDQYAAYWTLKWSDLIRNNSNSLGEQGMWALHNWIKESFRTNKPYNQFVRELVTAKGSIYSNGPANYFRVHSNSSALTEATSQIFLGVRLECAKCHHHPFEAYGQEDYYSMAAFFARVTSKNSEDFGLFGRETVVMVRASGEVSHPRTRKRLQPTPLGGEAVDHAIDRRLPLADWLTSPDNEFFARAVVNRYMGYLLGSGLVEPVDDMRSTNPPSNPAMLDALADDFVAHGFDLKHLVRTIVTSRLYGLSSTPTQENASDGRFYSHYQVKRLPAEPLLDAVDQATDVRTKFRNLPRGTRAIELPDAEYPNYFLTTFAKPRRVSVCECERSPDANLAQALHTLNGDTLAKKIADKSGRVMKLIEAKTAHDELVIELYVSSLCRLPTEQELELSRELLKESPSPAECYQDLLWALINSKQFLFVH